MTDHHPPERQEASDRLTRFANGERMQDIWTGDYIPDLMRADLALVLAAEEPA